MGNWTNLNSARYHLVKPTGSELQEISKNLIKYHKDHSQSTFNVASSFTGKCSISSACFPSQGSTIEVSKVSFRNFFYVHLRQVHFIHHPKSQRELLWVNVSEHKRTWKATSDIWSFVVLAPKSVRVRGNLITLTKSTRTQGLMNFRVKATLATRSKFYEIGMPVRDWPKLWVSNKVSYPSDLYFFFDFITLYTRFFSRKTAAIMILRQFSPLWPMSCHLLWLLGECVYAEATLHLTKAKKKGTLYMPRFTSTLSDSDTSL